MTKNYSLLILIRITIDDMLSDGLESVCSSQQHPTSRQSAIWLGSVPPGSIGGLRGHQGCAIFNTKGKSFSSYVMHTYKNDVKYLFPKNT